MSVIRPKILSIEEKIQQKKANGDSVSGLRRTLNKEIFNAHTEFFRMIIRNWLGKNENQDSLNYFYTGLQKLFFKVNSTNGIDRKIWDLNYTSIINPEQ